MLKHIALPLLAPDGAPSGGAAVATPPPAPTPTPASKPDAAPTPPDDSPFAALDARARAKATPKPAAEPAKEPEKPKEPEAPKAPDKPADKTGRQIESAKELRTAYEKSKGEIKSLTDKIAEYERKIAAAQEARKSVESINARLAAVEKEKEDAMAQLRAARREASPEFKEKYEAPFNRAAEFARRQVTALEVIEKPANEETGEQAVMRQATWEDFATLYQMPLNKAIRTAKQLFGDGAQTVLNHLTELQRLGMEKDRALEEEKTKAKEREDAELASQSQQREQVQKMWREFNTKIAERNPEFFQPDPNDKEASEILAEGFKVADSVHNSQSMTLQQRVRLDAEIRNRAAAHPLMVYKLTRANDRIAELEKKLEELKGSGPGSTQRPGGGGGEPAAEEWQEELRKLDPYK